MTRFAAWSLVFVGLLVGLLLAGILLSSAHPTPAAPTPTGTIARSASGG